MLRDTKDTGDTGGRGETGLPGPLRSSQNWVRSVTAKRFQKVFKPESDRETADQAGWGETFFLKAFKNLKLFRKAFQKLVKN